MYNILLVDDEPWVRTGIRKTIERTYLPFQVIHECEDGLEALAWIKSNKVNLVLADIRMPNMNGLELAKQVMQLSDKPELVLISVHDEFHYAQEALRIGVFDYLLKPVGINDMKCCLDKWLMSAKRSSQLPGREEPNNLPASPIAKVIKYIESTPPGKASLAEAAKLLHMNPCYLSHMFKQRMNMNFSDYIAEVRIKECKHLLENTELKVSDIAEKLGYPDAAYFSNIFKKISGVSPSEYRKQHREAH